MPASTTHSSFPAKFFLVAFTFVLWGFVLWRSIVVFAPSSPYVLYDSDDAVHILMANDDRPINIFDMYFWAQDRLGAWPLIAAKFVHRATAFRWSDQDLHVFKATWLFLGVLVIGALNRRNFTVTVLACLITICLEGKVRMFMFGIDEPYSWQLTPIIASWYGLRELFDLASKSSAKRYFKLRVGAWSPFILVCAFLSTWSSFASAIFLFFVLAVEGFRVHARSNGIETSRRLKTYAWGGVLFLAAILGERLLRANYYRHNLKHFGRDYRFPMHFDSGHLMSNLSNQLHGFMQFAWWPLALAPLLLLLVSVGRFVYRSRTKQFRAPRRLADVFSNDNYVLVIAGAGIALLNFAMITLVDHVRLNLYSFRYGTPTYFFGSVAGLLTLFIVFRGAMKGTRMRKYALPAAIVGVACSCCCLRFHQNARVMTTSSSARSRRRWPRKVRMLS